MKKNIVKEVSAVLSDIGLEAIVMEDGQSRILIQDNLMRLAIRRHDGWFSLSYPESMGIIHQGSLAHCVQAAIQQLVDTRLQTSRAMHRLMRDFPTSTILGGRVDP